MADNIGVVGAGVMGSGVAYNLAYTNHNVVLVDVSEEVLRKAEERISNTHRLAVFLNKNADKRPGVIEKNFKNIRFTTDYSILKDCRFLVENINENWELKARLYKQLDEICNPECIFAANTSCIPITKIAGITGRPDKVIGIHFMNPVHFKNTVEVIRGYHTSEECLATTIEFLKEMNKVAITVNDNPGFVSNRISHLFMNEAAYVVQEGVATASQVDEIFKKCYGHRMGPLETADLIGLDTVVDSLKVLYENYQDPKFKCCPLLQKMVYAGLYGRKSGEGFFDYKNQFDGSTLV